MAQQFKEILSPRQRSVIKQRKISARAGVIVFKAGVPVKSGGKFFKKQSSAEIFLRGAGRRALVAGKKVYEFEESERPKIEKILKKEGYL